MGFLRRVAPVPKKGIEAGATWITRNDGGDVGRPSNVERHAERARIDRMIDDGITYSTIVRTVGGTSVSAIGRYALSRKSELSKAIENEPGVTDILSRLVQVADHARDVRQRSKLSGSPVSQSRAIKSEAEILGKLLTELGVDDVRLTEVMAEAQAMATGIRIFVRTYPDAAEDLISIFEKTPETLQLAQALKRAGSESSS